MHSLYFPESATAHRLLDGKHGIEIGESAHNAFGLDTKNVDWSDSLGTPYKLDEIRICGAAAPVDIVAPGDRLPFPDGAWDFVASSHAIEHFWNPIGALREWLRVVKPGGFVFMIVPHKERTFDKDRELTTLVELLDRDAGRAEDPLSDAHTANIHRSVWVTETFHEQMAALSWGMGFSVLEVYDVDDKVGNGFTVVLRKERDVR